MKDLATLLRWSKKLDIKDQGGKTVETVYVRLVGDLDYHEAQQHALIASRRLRKKLKNNTTIEYDSLFLDVDDKVVEDLIFGILMAETGTFRDLAVEDLGEDVLTVPDYSDDDPSLEKREDHQEEQEKTAQDKIKLLRDKMDEKYEARKKELEVKPIDELKSNFIVSTINIKCLEEFSNIFRDYCCFSGTYMDSKFTKKVFNEFDEYQNVATTVKRQILDTYLSLELSGEQLKN